MFIRQKLHSLCEVEWQYVWITALTIFGTTLSAMAGESPSWAANAVLTSVAFSRFFSVTANKPVPEITSVTHMYWTTILICDRGLPSAEEEG